MQTSSSIEASEPDVYMGLGSMAYAIAKADNELQPEEIQTINRIFSKEAYGDLALRSFLLQEYHNESVETAYAFALRRLVASRHVLNDALKKHLLSLLWRVIYLCHRNSPKEQELVRRFQKDIQYL